MARNAFAGWPSRMSYLSCPPNFVTGNVRLACPNATAVDAANDAIRRGWIWWHAFPFNAHMELSQDGSLLRAAVELTHNLDDEFGLPRKSVLSQRDVPGLSVAALSTLARAGVTAISFGNAHNTS